jgi:hypothetical protein
MQIKIRPDKKLSCCYSYCLVQYERSFVKPTLDTPLRLSCNYSVFLQFKHSAINLNFDPSLLVCRLFYNTISFTGISTLELLNMLLKRLFYRFITYIHVADVFERVTECGRARDVIRRCAATDVVRSTVRDSALMRGTRDLQNRRRHRSQCNNAAISRVRAQLGPQNSYVVYSSHFWIESNSELTVSRKSLNLICT